MSRLMAYQLLTSVAVLASTAGVSAAPVWKELPVAGPPARFLHAMSYDPCRQVVALVGGQDGSTFFEDTWEWDGETWTLAAPTGPGPHRSAAMAFDPARCVAVLFGGNDPAGNYLNDTWEWDGSAWTQRCAACSPAPRSGAGMSFDRARGVVLLFGGYNPGGYLNDLWQWDGTAWMQVSSTPGPSPRGGVAMTYDAARDRTVVFGGSLVALPCGTRSDETWELDMSSSPAVWTLVSPAVGPSAREVAQMVYDDARGVVVLFGGRDCHPNLLGDTWDWDGSTWSELPGSGPGARYTHAMAYDAKREETVLFGGVTLEGVAPGNTWLLSDNSGSFRFEPAGPDEVFLVLTNDVPVTAGELALIYDAAVTAFVSAEKGPDFPVGDGQVFVNPDPINNCPPGPGSSGAVHVGWVNSQTGDVVLPPRDLPPPATPVPAQLGRGPRRVLPAPLRRLPRRPARSRAEHRERPERSLAGGHRRGRCPVRVRAGLRARGHQPARGRRAPRPHRRRGDLQVPLRRRPVPGLPGPRRCR